MRVIGRSAYPDKGGMGLAKHNPGGHARLGLSATAGSAVLYSAIVVFGIGSASPSAPDAGRDRNASVVLVPGHADIVPGSVKKLPQASPEPGRHRSRVRPRPRRTEVGPTTASAPPAVESQPAPAPPRGKESAPARVSDSSTAPVAAPLPSVVVPTLPVPELPAPLPLPELPAPPLPPLPLDLPG
jgi:hypothetical protein